MTVEGCVEAGLEEGVMGGLGERVLAAVVALEAAVERLSCLRVDDAVAASASASVEGITATVASARETELEQKLAEAEQTIASLRASAAGRKTAVGSVVAKGAAEGELAGVDAALASLSVEQRIAVKAGMLRAGLL